MLCARICSTSGTRSSICPHNIGGGLSTAPPADSLPAAAASTPSGHTPRFCVITCTAPAASSVSPQNRAVLSAEAKNSSKVLS